MYSLIRSSFILPLFCISHNTHSHYDYITFLKNVTRNDYCADWWKKSISGQNNLNQTTLGINSDSSLISHIFDEHNLAVKKILNKTISKANKIGTYISICRQAQSDFSELAQYLIDIGINSVSDTVIPFLMRYAQ